MTAEAPPMGSARVPERLALRIIEIGSIAVMLASTTLNIFDLDRFFVPKELVLHVTAVLATILAIRAIRQTIATKVDLLLAGFLLLSIVSTVFATNRWVGLRALAVTASAMALFWTGRGLRQAGLGRPLLNALAVAIAVAAITSLVQAYGVETRFFSLNRAPGGTLGNRNFIGHAAAFGLPLMLLAAIRARRFAFGAAGVAITVATLALTRSRAAWLATAAVLVILLGGMVASSALRNRVVWRRLSALIVVAAIATGAALVLPNSLHWRSDNPYLESVKGVVSYDEGSGRGRLIQWGRSMLMSARHPLFGVGPGNWPVEYPRHAPEGDRSLNPSEPGMTYNPWPSSDWVAYVSERGPVAAVLLGLAVAGLALAGLRRALLPRPAETAAVPYAADDQLEGLMLAAMIAAAVVAGMFDAVLLLPVATVIVWTAAGALWSPAKLSDSPRWIRSLAIAGAIVIAAAGAARSVAQLTGMETYATHSDRASLERASQIDPGNYRLHIRLARIERKRQLRCEHALAARSLFPTSSLARSLARGCSE